MRPRGDTTISLSATSYEVNDPDGLKGWPHHCPGWPVDNGCFDIGHRATIVSGIFCKRRGGNLVFVGWQLSFYLFKVFRFSKIGWLVPIRQKYKLNTSPRGSYGISFAKQTIVNCWRESIWMWTVFKQIRWLCDANYFQTAWKSGGKEQLITRQFANSHSRNTQKHCTRREGESDYTTPGRPRGLVLV